jgi:cytochrome b subunit of formate dehydrogenase
MGHPWVEGNHPGRQLILLYHSVTLVVLLTGMILWRRVFSQWRKVFWQASPVIQSYAAVSFADLLNIFANLCVTIGGFIHTVLPGGEC